MADVLHAYIAHNLEAKKMETEEPITKIKKLILPLEGEWAKLKDEASQDYAKIVQVNGAPYVVLPYRFTGMGAYRCHYVRQCDYVPETAFSWRFQGVDYIAFPHSGQRIVSIYRSNRGVVRVQIIEPNGRLIKLGETSEEAAEAFVQGMLQIYDNGEVHRAK
jgi:hypothetical protein